MTVWGILGIAAGVLATVYVVAALFVSGKIPSFKFDMPRKGSHILKGRVYYGTEELFGRN